MKGIIANLVGVLCFVIFATSYSQPSKSRCPPLDLIRQAKMKAALIYDIPASWTIHGHTFYYNSVKWELVISAVIWDRNAQGVMDLTEEYLQIMPLTYPVEEEYKSCTYLESDFEKDNHYFHSVVAYE